MRRVALPLALLIVASLALPAAVASPQPTPVCGPCGAGLEMAATDEADALQGLRVTESRAVVRVHGDGTATWTVTARVANETAVGYLRDHPEALDRVVRDALRYGTVDGPFGNVSARLDGNTVHMRYHDPVDASRRLPGGVVLVEYLHSRGYDTWDVLTADRLTIVGPPGTEVTNDPPGAHVEGRNATWEGNASAQLYDAPQVSEDAYVAYTSGGPFAGAWTALGIALATAPIVVDVVLSMLVPPLVLLGVLLGIAVVAGRRVRDHPRVDSQSVATVVSGLGALAFVLGLPGTESVLPLAGHRTGAAAGALALAMGALARWRGADARVGELVGAGCLVLVGFAATFALTLPGEYVTQAQASRQGIHEALRLLPLVAMPTLGAAIGSRKRTLWAGGLVAAAFVAAQLTVVWPTRRPFGLVVVFFLAYAVAVAVGGFPLLVLGACAAGRQE